MQSYSPAVVARVSFSEGRLHASKRRVRLVAGALTLLFLGGLGGGFAYQAKRRRFPVAADPTPSVVPAQKALVVHPLAPTGKAELTIPGTVRAVESVTLFAKAQGFVSAMHVNIGDRVKKGATLAEIDAPELADQVALAHAKTGEAEANVGLVRKRKERTISLVREGIASQQESEETDAQYNSAVADVSSARAEAHRLGNMWRYLRVIAPRDGMITRRYVDPGAVVNPGTTALFDVATSDELKVVVDVPQSLVGAVGPDTTAEIVSKSGAQATVKLLRSAGALDESTRTMRVELAVPARSAFLAGAYVDVKLALPRPASVRVLPASALYVDASGTRIVTVASDGLAHFTKITIARDLGREIEVGTPLPPETNVVLFPPAGLREGDRLVPVVRPP